MTLLCPHRLPPCTRRVRHEATVAGWCPLGLKSSWPPQPTPMAYSFFLSFGSSGGFVVQLKRLCPAGCAGQASVPCAALLNCPASDLSPQVQWRRSLRGMWSRCTTS